ncbi:MAG: tetratricopeptide repeat protein [Flavobacteriales bacterium]|nr:tetratricopeptide repeat protein [Flavobacteriales bacterium]
MSTNLKIIFLGMLSVLHFGLLAQREDKVKFNDGVDAYRNGNYETAQTEFVQAYQSNNTNTRALFNAGNAAYLRGQFDEAAQFFEDYSKQTTNKAELAKAFYNQGNVYLKKAEQAEQDPEKAKDAQGLYKKAISSYKESLKNDPTDQDTKYNLTYALSKLQQNQNQNGGGGQDENQDQNQDQNQDNNQDQNQNDQDQNGEGNQDQEKDPKDQNGNNGQGDQNEEKDQKDQEGQGNKGEQNDDQKEDQANQSNSSQQGQEKEGQMSKAQAAKDLDALNEDEGKVLQKVYGQRSDKKVAPKSGKDW